MTTQCWNSDPGAYHSERQYLKKKMLKQKKNNLSVVDSVKHQEICNVDST